MRILRGILPVRDYWDSHAMIGYSFRQSPLPWLKRLRVQLNVQNLFNEDDAYVMRRGAAEAAFRNVIGPLDATEFIRRTRMREPRSWRMSASFDF